LISKATTAFSIQTKDMICWMLRSTGICTGGAFTAPPVYTNPTYADRLAGIGPSQPEGGETDWQDEIYQTGPMQNYDLALSGGNENSTFRLSTGYQNQRVLLSIPVWKDTTSGPTVILKRVF